MDLPLQFEEITCFEMMGSMTAAHEETLETAIPEYCPDIARIVDTVGQLCIREKLPGKDRYTVSGTVKVTVLYTSEGVPGLRSLRLSVPFSCQWEDPRPGQCQMVGLTGRVLLAEAKAITSRKLYLRVLPEVTITPYCQVRRRLCTDTGAEQSLRIKRQEWEVNCLCDVAQKQFTFTQDLQLPEGEQAEDLLLVQMCPRVNSLQRIGNKFSLKGEMTVRALYRDENQTLRVHESVVPMAEILEGTDLAEDATYTVNCMVTEYDGRLLRTDVGSGVGITAGIVAEISAYCRKNISCVEDVYSLCHCTELQCESVGLPEDYPPRQVSQEAGERLEFPQADPFVFVSQWDLSPVAVLQEENGALLRTALHLKILYVDETGAPLSTERTVEISASTGQAMGNVTASCCGMSVHCSGNTCQLQGQVVFSVSCARSRTVQVLTAVNLTEEQGDCRNPSLVLRRMQSGETLWDIAKQYQTDADAIVAANPEGIDAGRLLLIPKIR